MKYDYLLNYWRTEENARFSEKKEKVAYKTIFVNTNRTYQTEDILNP